MIQDKRLATQRRLGIVMETEGWERALGRQALLVKAKMKDLLSFSLGSESSVVRSKLEK